MHNEDRDEAAHSGALAVAEPEPIESIEDILRKRGFFGEVETHEKG